MPARFQNRRLKPSTSQCNDARKNHPRLHGAPGERSNPISVNGIYFHNLKYLKAAFSSKIEISGRMLAQRVADLKKSNSLNRDDTLKLLSVEFSSLISRAIAFPFADFETAVTQYVTEHDLQLVRGGQLDIALALEPITAATAFVSYQNNRSPIYFRCLVCLSKGNETSLFSKPLGKWPTQGCPVCGDMRSIAKRRLQPDEVRARIAEHPAEIEWKSDRSTYVNNMSQLICACKRLGHEFKRPAQELFSYGSLVVCPICVPPRNLGESIAVGVSNFLLATGKHAAFARELTPSHLQAWTGKGQLRHDGYFELPELGCKIAIEHMGNQHFNANNPLHGMARGAKNVSFLKMQERDIWKKEACSKADICWVDIPDLYLDFKSLVDAAKSVATHLLEKTNFVVEKIPGFDARVRQLEDRRFVLSLVTECGMFPAMVKLQNQLDEEKSSVFIVDFEPMSNVFTLGCAKHAEWPTWTARAGNAIGSTATGRMGTRCRQCGAEKRGAKKRLTEQEIDSAVNKLGFKKRFSYEEYASNSTYLAWECLSDPEHIVHSSYGHLSRGCKYCREKVELSLRQAIEHAKLNEKVTRNGDSLLTTAGEYVNNSTKVRVLCSRLNGCGQPFLMTPQKIMAGQLCDCDKYARGALKRAIAKQSKTN